MRQYLDHLSIRSPRGLALALVCVVTAALLFPSPSTAAPEGKQLTAAAGSADAKFGVSSSISGDTAVVGAPDEGGTPEEGGMGAAYVFTKNDDGTWTERATLLAPNRADGDKFGYSVAIDGDTIVVGAQKAEQAQAPPGAAYVFVRSGDTWPLQATLTPSGSKPADAFGFEVAISGDTVVVGALQDDVGEATDQGSAYVFTRSGGTWTEQARLTAEDGAAGDGFGSSVAVSGETVVVGASADDIGTLGIDQGSASVFTRTGSAWTEQATLTAADGSAQDGFGASVEIDHDTVVVGATVDDLQGSAYVFERDAGSWSQQAKLMAPDGLPADQFGRSVATTGDMIAVGAHFHDDDRVQEGSGAVFVFRRVASGWSEPTELTEAGAGLLGLSVDFSGHSLIAGAGFTNVGENKWQGSAYVYSFRPPTQVVTIDVKPGDDKNRVRTFGNEDIAVAVLGTPAFDATTVDPSTVCFGDTPPPGGTTSYQQPPGADADCNEAHRSGHVQDVDGDGDLDMVLHFEGAQTGLDRGDTTVTLTGTTTMGGAVVGTDSIRTVP